MHFAVIFFAASASLVAAQTDPAGQCIQTCFAKVGQDDPDSLDIKRCQALADGLQQLLCLCRSTPLVGAFTTCTGETCPEFAAQVNGTAICQSSETGALDPSGSDDPGPSDAASGVDAGPSNTAVAGASPVSNTAGGAGPSNTASGAGASNTNTGTPAGGTQAPATTSGGTDVGNGVRSHGLAMVDMVIGGTAVALFSTLLA